MRVTLDPAIKTDELTLDNLIQLYSYDFSEFMPRDVGETGRFEQQPLARYFVDPWRHAYLLRVDDRIAGFALVHERSKLTAEHGIFDMAEFFVLRRYRRSGVGRTAALMAFDLFKGRWEVRQRAENAGAAAFWRQVIGAYTHGNFEEVRWDDAAWVGPVQRFTSPA
jgi:predicted acetyltransferase